MRERLARQFLTASGPGRASDVVRALGAVQAQDYAGAKWALGQRTRGTTTDAQVEGDLNGGAILRTHVLRPTWHFVSPEDIRWMLALTAPRVRALLAHYDRRLELTRKVLRRGRDAMVRALRGGRQLTRSALAEALQRAGVPATGQRLGHLVMHAELDAVICSGARQGKQFTYALLEERVPPAPAIERDEALLALTRRYFETRGPATTHDFAWWSGLTMADVKRGVQMAGGELERGTLDGREYIFTGRKATRPVASAQLLPNYDEYFIGHRDRSAIAQRLGHAGLVTGGNALISNVIVVDGQLVGGWKRTLEGTRAIVTLSPQVALTPAERRRIAVAVRKLGEFLEVEVEARG